MGGEDVMFQADLKKALPVNSNYKKTGGVRTVQRKAYASADFSRSGEPNDFVFARKPVSDSLKHISQQNVVQMKTYQRENKFRLQIGNINTLKAFKTYNQKNTLIPLNQQSRDCRSGQFFNEYDAGNRYIGGHLFKCEYGGEDSLANVIPWSEANEIAYSQFEEDYDKALINWLQDVGKDKHNKDEVRQEVNSTEFSFHTDVDYERPGGIAEFQTKEAFNALSDPAVHPECQISEDISDDEVKVINKAVNFYPVSTTSELVNDNTNGFPLVGVRRDQTNAEFGLPDIEIEKLAHLFNSDRFPTFIRNISEYLDLAPEE